MLRITLVRQVSSKPFRLGLSVCALAVLAACGGGSEESPVQATATATATASIGGKRALAATSDNFSGAIFTTDANCDGTDLNNYESKDLVYLNGGPQNTNAAGIPDGDYYVKVTTPDGDLLGYTTTASVQVVGGNVVGCPQLSAILVTATDPLVSGYDDTDNDGGVYKVWMSKDSAFPERGSKTDNFRVGDGITIEKVGTLLVTKFYDANADGVFNNTDTVLEGWKINVSFAGVTSQAYTTYEDSIALPGVYTVTELMPTETNWKPTTLTTQQGTVVIGQSTLLQFGNLCLGVGGGKTLGFWSNQNGRAEFGADDLAVMVSLNLRNANGTMFDPASYASFRPWLLGATASNMAYMLSAQLAAMQLNVLNGKVSGSSLIYAPGTGLSASGYATVSAVMAAANASLGTDGLTVSAGDARTLQEALKNALDNANNNTNFVQPDASTCPYSFATPIVTP
jgi:hypothetical protein